jgi:hypothetical protein
LCRARGQLSTAADDFTYEATPTVTAVSPVAGLPGGGTTVTITGTRFTGASAVDFATPLLPDTWPTPSCLSRTESPMSW